MKAIAGFLIVALGWLTWMEGGLWNGMLALILIAGGLLVAMLGSGTLFSIVNKTGNKKEKED